MERASAVEPPPELITRILFDPPWLHGSPHGSLRVTIPAHSSAGQIGDLLERDGVISSSFFFQLRATLSGQRGDLRSGSYHLQLGMSYGSVLKVLTTAPKPAEQVLVGVVERGQIGLTLVPDEETGGARGSALLTQQGLLGNAGIGLLTAEPTGGVVWNANRGAITLRVQVLGKSAHVGLQHQGENAFERMHHVVKKLLELKHEVEQRKTSYNLGAEQARNSILMLGGQSGGDRPGASRAQRAPALDRGPGSASGGEDRRFAGEQPLGSH